MKAIKILAVPLVAGSLFLACDEAPVPTDAPDAPAVELQANFTNGPDQAGVVVRSEYEQYIIDMFWETPADPWILWMGLAPGEVPTWCGGDGPGNMVPYQKISAKHGEKIIYNEMSRNMPVTVFDLQEHWDYFWEGDALGEDPYCYAVTRATPIGGGTASFKSNEGPAGWQAHVNGTVDYMGQTYRLKWMIKNPYSEDGLHVARVW